MTFNRRAAGLALTALLALTAASPTPQPQNPNAFALVYANFSPLAPIAAPRAVSATLTLPAKPSNANWYANWIMITGFGSQSIAPNFVQIGLIRNPLQDRSLHAFLAYVKWPKLPLEAPSDTVNGLTVFVIPKPVTPPPLVYKDLGVIPEGSHQVAMHQNGGSFSFQLDGKPIWQPLQLDVGNGFVQAGSETAAARDAISGTLGDLSLRAGTLGYTLTDGTVQCIVTQFGGKLAPSGREFTASGVMDTTEALRYEGNCQGVLANLVPSYARQ